jgi:hypothetical protein
VAGCLDHQDEDLREYAVAVLGDLGPAARAALPALVELTLRERRKGVRPLF